MWEMAPGRLQAPFDRICNGGYTGPEGKLILNLGGLG